MDRAMEMEQQGRKQVVALTTGASGKARPRPPSLLRVVREDFVRHSRNPLSPGFLALVVHRTGRSWLGAPRPLQLPLKLVWRVLYELVRGFYSIDVHRETHIGRRVRISQTNVFVNRLASVGDDCLLRQNVTLGLATDASGARLHSAPTLCNGVQVGANAVIIGPVVVGEGARIGPNTVVVRSVPPRACVMPAPTRVVRDLHEPREANGT
jgi:serine O-acetyltransferase